MSEVLDIIDTAAQTQDWVVLAVASVALIVPIVLKALGKKVPLVDAGVNLVVGILKGMKRKAPPALPPDAKDGVAAVVPVKDVSEQPKPMDTLK